MKHTFLFVLVDRQHGHFSVFDSQTKQLTRLEEITDTVPKPVKGASWKGLADDKVARHIDAHIHVHFQRVAAKLEELAKAHLHPSLILGGPEEVVAEFQKVLPKDLAEAVVAVLHPDHHADVKSLEKLVKEAVAGVERTALETAITAIEENRSFGGRGIVGREAVCEALNLKQVQLLFLHDASAYPGAYCPADGSVSALQTKCPLCLAEMASVPDLSEHLRTKAAEQNAHVMTIADLTLLPADAEGIAALRRY